MKRNGTDWLKLRVFLVFLFFFLAFLLVFLRILQLQILERENLQGLAEKQRQRVIELVVGRGTIYDRNERVMAKSLQIESLYAHPHRIKNVRKSSKRIAHALNTEWQVIEKKLKSQKPFVWLARKVSPPKIVEQIKGLKLRGVDFLKESQRYYPNVELAANLMGFVGVDSQGLEGLEFQYNRYLRGEPHRLVLERDARGAAIITESPVAPADLSSCSLILTIDLNIQYIVEKAITQAVKDSGAKSAIVVVMDPRNGQILAMASRPSFNPNVLKPSKPRFIRNRAITDIFEPGSIFKVFLLAVALEEKVAKRDDIFFCHNGTYRIGREIIHDHKKHGWLTLQKVIKYSSNIGASQIGHKVGARRFDRYIRNFGFGARTGIELPGEVKGIVRDPDELSEVGIANTSFGQGISVTAIQLVTALSAIANGGTLIRPYVVHRIVDQRGQVIRSFKPGSKRQVISPATSREVTEILKEVVEPGGTGTQAALLGYQVAGKTGTAQKIDPLLKKYADDKYISSFMGFAPADAPRLAILVVIDEPKGTPYGGVVAAPVFRTIAQQTLQYLNVPPSKSQAVAQVPPKKERSKKIRRQKTAEAGTRAQSEGLMPNLLGLSMKAALAWLQERDVEIRLSGRGILLEQEPRPGAPLRKGSVCRLIFAPLS